jgi:hypothetical protein
LHTVHSTDQPHLHSHLTPIIYPDREALFDSNLPPKRCTDVDPEWSPEWRADISSNKPHVCPHRGSDLDAVWRTILDSFLTSIKCSDLTPLWCANFCPNFEPNRDSDRVTIRDPNLHTVHSTNQPHLYPHLTPIIYSDRGALFDSNLPPERCSNIDSEWSPEWRANISPNQPYVCPLRGSDLDAVWRTILDPNRSSITRL